MRAKYLLIDGNKRIARKIFIDGWFITWNENSVKNAFAGGRGTIKDFERFARDNAGNSTHIDIDTMTYIDTGKPADIDKSLIYDVFSKYCIDEEV